VGRYRRSSNKSEEAPRYYVPGRGWQRLASDEATVRIIPIKVWSYSRFNENTLETRDADGRWLKTDGEGLSPVERGLVFNSYPRQGEDGGPPYYEVYSAARLVDAEIANLVSDFSDTDLKRADWKFSIPSAKWEAFQRAIENAGGQIVDRSVRWEKVEAKLETVRRSLDCLQEISDRAARVPLEVAQGQSDAEPADLAAELMAAYDGLAREAKAAAADVSEGLGSLRKLRDSLALEPGRFREKARLEAALASLEAEAQGVQSLPSKLAATAKAPLERLAELRDTVADTAATRWDALTACLAALYPAAVFKAKPDGLLVRLGDSVVLFADDKIVAI